LLFIDKIDSFFIDKYTSKQIYKQTNIQANKYTSKQIYKQTNIQAIETNNPTRPQMYAQQERASLYYTMFIKQFISQLAFAKLSMIVRQQTTDMARFVSHTDEDALYQTILRSQLYTRTVWDDVFSEQNIDIPLRYYADLYKTTVVDATDEDDYYPEEMVYLRALLKTCPVYLAEPYNESAEQTHTQYMEQEILHRVKNSIIREIVDYVNDPTGKTPIRFMPEAFYQYTVILKKRASEKGIRIADSRGNLDITESVLHEVDRPLRLELYTVWLANEWLK